MLGQWATELSHVAQIVGGFNSQTKNVGQQGVRFTPIARDRQQRAVQFLNAQAFRTPSFLIKPEILRRIEPVGVLDRDRSGPAPRAELAALDGAGQPSRRAGDARRRGGVPGDGFPGRRSQGHLERGLRRRRARRWTRTGATCSARTSRRSAIAINGRAAAADDARAFFRGELKTLDADLKSALGKIHRSRHAAAHRGHPDADRARARPRDPGAGAAAGAAARPGTSVDEFDVTVAPDACWLDYTIRPNGRVS